MLISGQYDRAIVALDQVIGKAPAFAFAHTLRARAYLAKKGYDPMNGARPLGRVIQDEIKRPLTDEMLFGKLASGGSVRVDLAEERVTFDFGTDKALPAVN